MTQNNELSMVDRAQNDKHIKLREFIGIYGILFPSTANYVLYMNGAF